MSAVDDASGYNFFRAKKRNPSAEPTVTIWGAARNVTGSMHQVEARGHNAVAGVRVVPGKSLREYASQSTVYHLPFGGNRTCLGMAFALYEMKVELATLFSQIRLARPPGARSRPLRRGSTLGPDEGVQMVVTWRL